jgi:hypothetical protein
VEDRPAHALFEAARCGEHPKQRGPDGLGEVADGRRLADLVER